MNTNLSYWRLPTLTPEEYADLLKRTESSLDDYLPKAREIVEDVRRRGDLALTELTAAFDGVQLAPERIRVTPEEVANAAREIDEPLRRAILMAKDNILKYHTFQMPKQFSMTTVASGVLAGERFGPIPSVACYVPRGKGSFPSVCLMTTVPAVVCGVPRIILITPPGPDGLVDAATLFAADAVGITEIYKCGGAQAMAAVAFGTKTIPKCDKIVGPGSPWVVAAKHLLSRHIDPGPPAGPSEAIVLADSTADAWKSALDLVNESEHGPDSSAFLVTDSEELAAAVDKYVPFIWEAMGEQRRSYSKAVLTGAHGGIVLCRDMNEAVAFANNYAPEHLQVHSATPFTYLEGLKHAGEILLGEHASICLGNFVLGPNAILPTNSMARTASPLSVYDYLKRTSVVHVTEQGYQPLAAAAEILARYEGFDGHALAASAFRANKPRV